MTELFNAASSLRAHAEQRPLDPCLRMPAPDYTTRKPRWTTTTFQQLDRRSDAFARELRLHGVAAGDRTLILFRPCPDFFAVGFALYKLGAVPVLIDPSIGLRAMLNCITQAAPSTLIALPIVHAIAAAFRGTFASVRVRLTVGQSVPGISRLDAPLGNNDEPLPLEHLPAEAPASLLFTSGSTGPPKGVIATQGMFAAQLESLREMLHQQPGSTQVQAFAPFAALDICAGVCSVIPKIDVSNPAKASPAEIVAAIQSVEPVSAFASPVIWHNVARYCERHDVHLPSLRTALTVGAPVPISMHQRYRAILAEGAEMLTPYGATEALPVSNIGSLEILASTAALTNQGFGTCVGRAVSGVTIHVIRVSDGAIGRWSSELELPVGECGEIVVAGLPVSQAYHQAALANQLSKIPDGDRVLHRMGDLGYLDTDGRLWFCGRKSHRLQTARGMIAPVAVEGVFNRHPDLARCALVGVGRPGRQVPVLCVEMLPGRRFRGRTVGELLELARGTRHEGVVQHFLPHPGFPTDPRHNSKIRREVLRDWAAARLNRPLAKWGVS